MPIPSENKGWGINDSIIYNCIIPIIKEVAVERNISMIDLNTAMKPYYPNEYQDGVHPNKYGARVIAETIYKSITGMDLLDALKWFYGTMNRLHSGKKLYLWVMADLE